jgi:hypothetical protein
MLSIHLAADYALCTLKYRGDWFSGSAVKEKIRWHLCDNYHLILF